MRDRDRPPKKRNLLIVLQESGQATGAPIRFTDGSVKAQKRSLSAPLRPASHGSLRLLAAPQVGAARLAAIANRAAPHFYIQTQLLGREERPSGENATLRVDRDLPQLALGS